MQSAANVSTFEYHTELNPSFWINATLRPEIKEQLIKIATAFLESLELEVDVDDVTFTGSLANYNYTKFSDVDLHIITDFNDYNIDSLVLQDYFDSKKTVWNIKHDITIKEHEVELYVQSTADLESMKLHKSTGVYSLKTNTWLAEPVKIDSLDKIDSIGIDLKKKHIIDLIDYALLADTPYEEAKKIKERILKLRQAGLDKEGEFSSENLAFKELRRTGYIEKLISGILKKKSEILSLKQENFKMYSSLSGIERRGPRHQSLTAGVGAMTNTKGKSVGMIAKSHTDKETPFPKIERLKAKKIGAEVLTPQEARGIAAFYDIDLEEVKTRPRGLSTSSIKLTFNPTAGVFILAKNK